MNEPDFSNPEVRERYKEFLRKASVCKSPKDYELSWGVPLDPPKLNNNLPSNTKLNSGEGE